MHGRTETLTRRAEPRPSRGPRGGAATETQAGDRATRWWPGHGGAGTRREIGRHPGIDLRQGTIGRFVVREELGHGAFGAVYRAFDPHLCREVALKVLHGTRADHRERVLAEARALARVNHPNVVSVYEVGEVDGIIYLAMELVEGQTLRAWADAVRPRRRRLVELLVVFDQMLLGLAAAHEEGLIHRDVKPDNVLISRTGRVVVLDFGLARAMSEAAPPAAPDAERPDGTLSAPLSCVAGTPAYMSPEQHLGHRLDARSDQFSAVVAFWELLYGERPFRAESYAEQVDAVTHHRIASPPRRRGVSQRFQQALRRALRADPQARFSDLFELRAALLRALNIRLKTREIVRTGLTILGVAAAITLAGAQLIGGTPHILLTMAGVSCLMLLTSLAMFRVPARSFAMRWLFPVTNAVAPALLFSAIAVDVDYVAACASWFPLVLMFGILGNVVNLREPRRVWLVAVTAAAALLTVSVWMQPLADGDLPAYAGTPSMILRLSATFLVAFILARLASLSELNPGMLVRTEHAPPAQLSVQDRAATQAARCPTQRPAPRVPSPGRQPARRALPGHAGWSLMGALDADAPLRTESLSAPWRRAQRR